MTTERTVTREREELGLVRQSDRGGRGIEHRDATARVGEDVGALRFDDVSQRTRTLERGRNLGGFARRGCGRTRGVGIAQEAVAHQFLEPRAHGVHLEAVKEGRHLLALPSTHGEVLEREVERHVAHELHDLGVVTSALLEGSEVFAQLRRQTVQVLVEVVEVPVLREELRGGLLAHPGNPGQVVRGVAAQGGEQRVALGFDAATLEDARFVVERVVRDPAPVVEDLDEGVLDELKGIAVPRDDYDGNLRVASPGGEGGEHVVRFELGDAVHGDVQDLTERADELKLVLDLEGRLGATALVVLGHRVTERAPREVKGHAHRARLLGAHERVQHRGKAVQRVGHHALGGLDVRGQGEERAKGQRHAV